MSRFSGRQHKGALKQYRLRQREAAEARNEQTHPDRRSTKVQAHS